MEHHKYYYVILGSCWDLYKHCYRDILKMDNAIYISDDMVMSNPLLRLVLSDRHNLHIPNLLRKYIRSLLLKSKIQNNRPFCFLMFSNWVRYSNKTGLIDALKKEYPNSRFVWFIQDLYRTVPYPTEPFDLILSFDMGDSLQYGFHYYPLVFSKTDESINMAPIYDVYFLGKAKNRLSEILRAFEIMKDQGLRIDMNLVDVPKSEQIYADEINYIKGMAYEENLQHLSSSKCALEIMQQGGVGYTMRYHEAIVYGKKLLSNNPYIKNSPFYDKKYMSYFENSDMIDTDFLRNIKSGESICYNYNNEFSPINLIKFIDNLL